MASSLESSLMSRSETLLSKVTNSNSMANILPTKSGSIFVNNSVKRFNIKENPQFAAYDEEQISKDLTK